MTDLNRIRKLAGVPLMEAAPMGSDQDEEARMAELDAQADREISLEEKVRTAVQQSSISLNGPHAVYIETSNGDYHVEAKLDIANSWPLKHINDFRNNIGSLTNDLAYDFNIAIAGQDSIMISFKVEIKD